MSRRLALLLVCLLAAACSSGGSSSLASDTVAGDVAVDALALPDVLPLPDAGEDGGTVVGGDVDLGDASDLGLVFDSAVHEDVSFPDVAPPPIDEPAVAPAVEPRPLPVASWMIGALPAGSTDPVMQAIDDGTFGYPSPGTDANGVVWTERVPGEDGGLGDLGGLGYAVTRLTLETPARVVARADRVYELYLDGAPQPGDFYGSGRMRSPLVGRAGGENLLVVQASSWRGEPRVTLETTPNELAFNRHDLTAPDLVVGDTGELWIGVAVLNLTPDTVPDLRARVLESEHFEGTEIRYPALPGAATTQIGFQLLPKAAFGTPEQAVPVRLRLAAPSLAWSYEEEIELATVARTTAYRRTFRSPVDRSVQYYGVLEPPAVSEGAAYGLVLSLHGAGVDAIGMTRAYSPKDWAYIVNPTNRRPFGFDWEEWGQLNGLEALAHAKESFRIDETRVYVTGHSMGGHGTWHLGVMHPGLFAVVGPSAGWASFYTYGGDPVPTGPFGRARAHSNTMNYLENLAHRGVFVIHGSADDNVPVREGRDLVSALDGICEDLFYYEQPGAGHWWDGDFAEGVDCVDYPALFGFMQARRLDPSELEFTFVSPSPSYSPSHSFVTLRSAASPNEDCRVTSTQAGDTVVVTTENVRSLVLDGAALRGKGIATAVVDGASFPVGEGPIAVGPQSGKRPGVHGPFNEVFRRPFCFVFDPDGASPAYARYASYLVSFWAVIGNGHACAVPVTELTDELRRSRNLVYLGLAPEALPVGDLPFDWDDGALRVAGASYEDAALLFVYPDGERLSAVLTATEGAEHLLFRVVPFSSRGGLPDYLVFTDGGFLTTGFFDAEWRHDPALAVP